MAKVIQLEHRTPGKRDECRQYVKNVYTRSMRMRKDNVTATWGVSDIIKKKKFIEIY